MGGGGAKKWAEKREKIANRSWGMHALSISKRAAPGSSSRNDVAVGEVSRWLRFHGSEGGGPAGNEGEIAKMAQVSVDGGSFYLRRRVEKTEEGMREREGN